MTRGVVCAAALACSLLCSGVSAQGNATALVDGVPINGYTFRSRQTYYTASWSAVTQSDTLAVTVESFSGTPRVYVTLNWDGSSGFPGPGSSVQADYVMYDSGVIVVPFGDASAAGCTIGTACPLSITVYGVTSTAYSISSSSNSAIQVLTPGVPQSSFVASGSYEYFSFTTSNPLSGLQIVLTQVTGDADLFVSTITNQPSIYNFTWYAVGLNDDFITIPANSAGWISAPATYYVGVYGFTNATYTLMAIETAGKPLVTLIDGNPQAGITPAGHSFSYYNFSVVTDSDLITPLDVFASEESGQVDIYVSLNGAISGIYPSVICADPNPSAPGGCNEYSVDPNTYTYSSTGSAQADFLSIPASALSPGQSVIIGVLATTPDSNGIVAGPSSFDLTVTSSNALTELQNGVGVQGIVGPNSYKWYEYQTTAWGNDVVISTLMQSGALDLYVSESPFPTAGNSTWNTTNGGGLAGNDVVYIPFSTLSVNCRYSMIRGLPCTLYISVLGWKGMQAPSAALYSLTAAISGSTYFPIRMQQGRLDRRPIPVAGYQYYLGSVNITQGESIYAIAQDYSGSSIMYAVLANQSSGKTFASPANNFAADGYSADLGGFAIISFSPPASASASESAAASGAVNEGALAMGRALAQASRATPATTVASAGGISGLTRVEPVYQAVPIYDGGRVSRRVKDAAYIHKYRPSIITQALHEAAAAVGLPPATTTTTSSTQQQQQQEAGVASVAHPVSSSLTATPTAYCTSQCTLYLTVGATGSVASDAAVYYTNGATTTQLQSNAAPLPSTVLQGVTEYYTVTVQDPMDDLTVTITQTFGAVNAYIIVQSPRRPYQMPGSTLWQWQVRPWTGATSYTISHSDPQFCTSHDDTITTAPCTYIIAVAPRFTTAPQATYTISASVNSSVVITPLQDGVGYSSSVIEGAYSYFSFEASTDGRTVVSPILIDAESFEGRVEIYVTNQYVPGVTPTTYLPSKGNTNVCQWANGNFSVIYIQSTDPCFAVGRQVYTIGILGATGITQPVPSDFVVTATDNGFLIRNIEWGVPRFNQFVFPNMNSNYSFILADGGADVIVSATSTHGDVAMMIAPFDPANPVLPSCYKGASGAQAICSGYTILTYGNNFASGVGSTSVYIPASNPCNAYAGFGMPAPTLNTTSCSQRWGSGASIAVVVYGFDQAEYSVSVQQPGTAMELADGQPQLAMTTPFTFCPARDNSTGQCTGSASGWTQASAAFVTFTLPASFSQVDQYVMVERICPGMVDGNCGNNLHMYATACNSNGCTAMDGYPYWGYNVDDAVVVDSIGSIGFPSCYPNGAGLGASPCVYTVGIFPICGNPLTNPGIGCMNNLVRVTWMGDTGIERIPSDCFQLGATCTLPPENLGTDPNAVRRYEAYAGDLATGTIITVEACAGDVIASLCTLGTGTSCNPSSLVGPSNFDYQASTRNTNTRSAVFSTRLTGGFFLGVSEDPQSLANDPQFDVILSSGTGQRLAVPPAAVSPNAFWDPTGTNLTIGWQQAILVAGGQYNQYAQNAIYSVYAFPSILSPRYNLEAACGVNAAFQASLGYIANSTTTGFEVIFSGLDSTKTYEIALTVFCPAGACLTQELQGQRLAYIPTVVGPPGPAPTPTPTVAPIPAPGNPPSKAGAVAGGVIGALLGVGIIAGLVYFFVLRPGAPYPCKGSASSRGAYGSLNAGSDEMGAGLVSSYAAGPVAGSDVDLGAGYSSL